MRKTTDVRVMRKEVETMKGSKTCLLLLGVKYWNELSTGYFIEYEELSYRRSENKYVNEENSFSVDCIEDLIKECFYWLSCYYELGNCRHDDEFNDRKAFIKFLSVFIPYSNLLNDDIKELFRHYWLPKNKDTEVLLNR